MRKDRFSDEALRNAMALAELKYSENPEDQLAFEEAYDFALCQRPDGSFYGTGGQCRKGSPAGEKAVEPKKSQGTRPKAAIEADMKKLTSSGAMQQKGLAGVKARAEHAKLKAELAGAGAPKKLKTDFRKDVEASAAKRKARDEKIVARQNRDKELLTSIRGKIAEQRALKKDLASLERGAKEAARKVKKDPSKENKDQLKRVNAALRAQDRAVAKMEREIDKMARERGRISQQQERERMTPAQRREAARIRKIIKERG
jgi:hypothetical protein